VGAAAPSFPPHRYWWYFKNLWCFKIYFYILFSKSRKFLLVKYYKQLQALI